MKLFCWDYIMYSTLSCFFPFSFFIINLFLYMYTRIPNFSYLNILSFHNSEAIRMKSVMRHNADSQLGFTSLFLFPVRHSPAINSALELY